MRAHLIGVTAALLALSGCTREVHPIGPPLDMDAELARAAPHDVTTPPDEADSGPDTSNEDTTPAPEEVASPWRLLDYVDPLISTGGVGFNVGSGVPGAQAPFGMVKVSPDTDGIYMGAGAYH